MGDTTTQSAEELDDIFKYLKTSFSDRSDYLKILVKAFRSVLKDHTHLNLFWLIIPVLTLNYVENMLLGKDRMKQNNPFTAFFCVIFD